MTPTPRQWEILKLFILGVNAKHIAGAFRVCLDKVYRERWSAIRRLTTGDLKE